MELRQFGWKGGKSVLLKGLPAKCLQLEIPEGKTLRKVMSGTAPGTERKVFVFRWQKSHFPPPSHVWAAA